ncbi:hypothetical protein ACFYZ2_14990 [Streptomyces sviceus]
MTAGTGTAELEGEEPARGGVELGHAPRDTDGHLPVPPALAGN